MADKSNKDAIITLVENREHRRAQFDGDEVVLSIPYSRVLEAAQFCERERLDHVFLGFKNKAWQFGITNNNFEHFITVDSNGISPKTAQDYVYSITPDPFS